MFSKHGLPSIFFALIVVTQSNGLPWLSKMLFASSTMQLDEADMALSHSVTVGAYAAVYECSRQFKYERWNCPASAFFLNGTVTLPQSTEISRETALVRAMTSAGIAFTLTKNCSAGDFADCVCGTKFSRRQAGFKWGGCSDNFQFGSLVARQFLDGQESGADIVSLVNLHNNAAGRVAVKKTMRRMCKCHGVSGSCATQTCWRQISDFKAVGEYLKKGHKKAVKVKSVRGFLVRKVNNRKVQKRHQRPKIDNRSNALASKRRQGRGRRDEIERNRIPAKSGNKRRRDGRSSGDEEEQNKLDKVKKRQIVYLQDSTDYCNPSQGFPGVLGRKCAPDPNDPNPRAVIKQCAKLCRSCGLKPKREIKTTWTSCNCRFRWCCDVTCETCRRKIVETTCIQP